MAEHYNGNDGLYSSCTILRICLPLAVSPWRGDAALVQPRYCVQHCTSTQSIIEENEYHTGFVAWLGIAPATAYSNSTLLLQHS